MLDGFLPLGPFLVTADDIRDPQNLSISCWVNGERKQHSSTADLIFSVPNIIAFVSRHTTLKPGDVIATGTPEGVLFGQKAPQWLKAGDEVSVEIEGLGRLTNRLVAPPSGVRQGHSCQGAPVPPLRGYEWICSFLRVLATKTQFSAVSPMGIETGVTGQVETSETPG